MKTLVYEGNHTLVLKENEVPEVAVGEVLIRVAYTGICGTDMHIWHDGMARVKPPVILGHEFSGVIERTGSPDSAYKPGDRVVVEPLITRGTCPACVTGNYNVCTTLKLIGVDTDGGMAKFVKAPEHKLFRLPNSVSLRHAALVEPLSVGVHMVRTAAIQQGQNVLITGGGPIGLIVASIAKLHGANVYVSEINPYRIGKAEELGFQVLNPKEGKVGDRLRTLTNGKGADASFEATGTQFGITDCIDATGIKGMVVIAGLPKKPPEIDTNAVVVKELNIRGSRVYKSEDYQYALELMESGRFDPEPFVSRIIGLDEVIEAGFKSIDRGDPVVKILVQLENGAGYDG
ncbi:zinc-binding dehydrogenase [Paenibacillus sp. J2TS4]|uniref:zinc-dependent alcohol dehydrogenase n=1 Tax=Paenibacillus sp. J2TS4 TaxID=2807194 RepID=UPI001B051883|nr:alcohol dehydrogenase catalytic domain-containing protein [Paenibacillus sp. J2TS4]GIP31613.1 Zn-dependent alcohol dehydrogenase [Paenibacillus sp. J2TS4]